MGLSLKESYKLTQLNNLYIKKHFFGFVSLKEVINPINLLTMCKISPLIFHLLIMLICRQQMYSFKIIFHVVQGIEQCQKGNDHCITYLKLLYLMCFGTNIRRKQYQHSYVSFVYQRQYDPLQNISARTKNIPLVNYI